MGAKMRSLLPNESRLADTVKPRGPVPQRNTQRHAHSSQGGLRRGTRSQSSTIAADTPKPLTSPPTQPIPAFTVSAKTEKIKKNSPNEVNPTSDEYGVRDGEKCKISKRTEPNIGQIRTGQPLVWNRAQRPGGEAGAGGRRKRREAGAGGRRKRREAGAGGRRKRREAEAGGRRKRREAEAGDGAD